ncbi:MAG: YggT family protein [Actinobacteria bacterium]|nr:YggT family protein [Actinomycetota bacterium]
MGSAGCFISAALGVYTYILFARIILSWVTMTSWTPPAALAPVIGFIYDVTEPVMGFFRRIIPPIGGLDISPILIFIMLSIIRSQIC